MNTLHKAIATIALFFFVISTNACDKSDESSLIPEPDPIVVENTIIGLGFYLEVVCPELSEVVLYDETNAAYHVYDPGDLPALITNQEAWYDRQYIGTYEIIGDVCCCIVGGDPIPGQPLPPPFTVTKVKIIEINEL